MGGKRSTRNTSKAKAKGEDDDTKQASSKKTEEPDDLAKTEGEDSDKRAPARKKAKKNKESNNDKPKNEEPAETKGEENDKKQTSAKKKACKKKKSSDDEPKKGAGKVKTGESSSPKDFILNKMMELYLKRNNSSTTLAKTANARKATDNSDNHSFGNLKDAWQELIEEGFIWAETNGPDSDYKLTDKGVDYAMPNEYKELEETMESTPAKTTEEHHERIKKLHCDGWNGRGVEIFDLLLKHGSCKRKELAALIGIHMRGDNFFYSLQRLRQHNYVETDPNCRGNIRLSDKAFLSMDDRPEPVPIDPQELEEGMEKVFGREMITAQQIKVAKAEAKRIAKGKNEEEVSVQEEIGMEATPKKASKSAKDKETESAECPEKADDEAEAGMEAQKVDSNDEKEGNKTPKKASKKSKESKGKKKQKTGGGDPAEDEDGSKEPATTEHTTPKKSKKGARAESSPIIQEEKEEVDD